MKKIFMLVGMIILLIAITTASGCQESARESFVEGVFHWRYNPSESYKLVSYEHNDELFIDEVQIEVKNITKEEYDASNFKNVIKNIQKEEYHSIIIKFKYSKETELTQYDMYDMFEERVGVGEHPDDYPIRLIFDNDKYNIKGNVKFILRPDNEYVETLNLYCGNYDYWLNTERPLTVNGVISKFKSPKESFSWYFTKDKPRYDSFIFSEYAYIFDENKNGDYLHELTEDLIIDEVHVSFEVITNEEYFNSNFVNVVMTDLDSDNPRMLKITLKLKFTCESVAKEYDVIFLPGEKHYYDYNHPFLVKLINEELNLNVDLKFNLSEAGYLTFTYNHPVREYTINDITYYDYGYKLSFLLERIGERL